jgi:hypothetical protein
MVLVRLLFPKRLWLALAAGWSLTVMPWHVMFSRVGFEVGIAAMGVVWMLVAWLKVRAAKKGALGWWVVGILSVASSLYVYHAARITVPLMLLTIALHEWFRNQTWVMKQARALAISASAALILLLPLAFALIWQKGGARAMQTTLFFSHTPLLPLLGQLFHNTTAHLSLQFLIGGATTTLRHGTGSLGVLLISQLILVIIGVATAFGMSICRDKSVPKYTIHPIVWLIFLVFLFHKR